MEEHIEKYKVREALFKKVDKILTENGSFHIDYTEECATLYYSYAEPERVYKVLKGDTSDTLELFVPATGDHKSLLCIKTGDTVIFEAEEDGKVWFSYPKCLIGHEADDMEDAVGFTEHGSLSVMIDCGLIGKETIPTGKPVIKKTIPRIRTAKQKPAPEDRIYAPGENAIIRAKKLFARMKDALLDIANISGYMSKYDTTCIRTLKISELSRFNSCSINNPAAYIRLAGRWLEKAGFETGESIQVVAINDMILIIPVRAPIIDDYGLEYAFEPE